MMLFDNVLTTAVITGDGGGNGSPSRPAIVYQFSPSVIFVTRRHTLAHAATYRRTETLLIWFFSPAPADCSPPGVNLIDREKSIYIKSCSSL